MTDTIRVQRFIKIEHKMFNTYNRKKTIRYMWYMIVQLFEVGTLFHFHTLSYYSNCCVIRNHETFIFFRYMLTHNPISILIT